LTGEPLIALAPGFRPDYVRGERLLELVRGPYPTLPIALDPSQEPVIVAYVRYDGQGIAHLPSGEDIGPVPGVIVVPMVGGTAPMVAIWDETGRETATLILTSCVQNEVCVLLAGSITD
jgi:eukaryotic-like serine/threonine-protein kinase